jgi:hypothetical protein
MSHFSTTGIIPEELMYPAKVGEVMQFLIDAPIPGDTKEELLFGWARTVGVKLNSSQYAKVSKSGIGE